MNIERRKQFQKALVLFLVLMAVCTLVSRAADSMTIPKAVVQKPEQGRISSKLAGNGIIEASEKKTHLLPAGCLIETCLIPGTDVEPGDVLIQFQMEQLEQQKQELETELAKQKLLLEQGELGLVPDIRVPEQEIAQNAMAEAQTGYDAAAAAYQQAAEYHQQKLAELEEQKKSQQEQAKKEKDQEKRQQQLKEIENSYNQNKMELDAALASADSTQKEAQKGLDQSRQSLEMAQKNDSAVQQNEDKAKKAAGLGVESTRMEVEALQKKSDRVNQLLAQEGKVLAEESGTFLDSGIAAGTVTTGSEFISIGTGGYEFSAEIPEKEQKKIAVGDVIELKIFGKEKLEGTVSQVLFQKKDSEEDIQTVILKAELPEDSYTSGMQASFSIEQNSQEEYQCLVPLTALRQDSKGYYCLGIRKKDSILGEEIVAERVNISLLDKNDSVAAVEGPIQFDTKIIVGSEKDVEPGDRVRIEE